jgi:hypothetical protein
MVGPAERHQILGVVLGTTVRQVDDVVDVLGEPVAPVLLLTGPILNR